jgi:c-di-GMP-binding flagellar brake protein YcgR
MPTRYAEPPLAPIHRAAVYTSIKRNPLSPTPNPPIAIIPNGAKRDPTMSHQNVEDRRKHKRILLPEHQFLHCRGINPKFEGQVSIIGAGGLFVRTNQSLSMGQTIRLKIEHPNLNLEVEAKVRDVTETGAGLEFNELNLPSQRTLQDFLRSLRP